MAISEKIEIHNEATPELRRLYAELGPNRLNAAIGTAEKLLFQKNFLSLPANNLGFPSTHFWAQAARATNFQLDGAGVTISVNKQGVRQRLEGGIIKPKGGKKFLTIPALPQAYGKRAGEFNSLRFSFVLDPALGKMRPALVEGRATEIKFGARRRDGSRSVTATQSRSGLVPFYWLIREADQKKNPKVIPSESAIRETALQEISRAAARARNKGGNA